MPHDRALDDKRILIVCGIFVRYVFWHELVAIGDYPLPSGCGGYRSLADALDLRSRSGGRC